MQEIGRASCRERVYISVVAVSLKKNFFKQKTAYEMPMCDWSSDVCSSDLNKLCKILKEEEIPDHLTCLLRNLYRGESKINCPVLRLNPPIV